MENRYYKNRIPLIVYVLIILSLVLSACGPAALGLDTTETATAVQVEGTTAPVVKLMVSSDPALGSILTDQIGMTLYYSTNDTARTTHCTGDCLQTWPAVNTSGTPTAGDPSIKGKIGWINRSDGGRQVTYNNMPLYYYIHDNMPGDVNGANLGNGWVVAQPSGSPK